MKSVFVILFLLSMNQVWAQTDTIPQTSKKIDFLHQLNTPNTRTGGKVTLHGDPKINQLLELNLAINKKEHAFQGFRIQILSTSSSNTNVDSLKSHTRRFQNEFPDLPAYLQYIDPDFKIRVGNFRTRIETIPALKRIRKKYPASYPVKTTIYMKELNPVQKQDTILPSTEPMLF